MGCMPPRPIRRAWRRIRRGLVTGGPWVGRDLAAGEPGDDAAGGLASGGCLLKISDRGRGDTMARSRNGAGSVPECPAGQTARAPSLLGHGPRLAQGRGQADRTHGWPGSVLELLKVIEPLTDPAAHGGATGGAFHLVIPSLPGYGFSARPQVAGWDPDRIARLGRADKAPRIHPLRRARRRLGAVVTEAMGRQAPAGLAGIHVNLPTARKLTALRERAGSPPSLAASMPFRLC
jgi:hypothetical protein